MIGFGTTARDGAFCCPESAMAKGSVKGGGGASDEHREREDGRFVCWELIRE